MKVYRHYSIPGYPSNIPFIVSDEGYGKNDYVKTTRSLVVVTARTRKRQDGYLSLPSCIMNTREASRPVMPNMRPFNLEYSVKASGKPGL